MRLVLLLAILLATACRANGPASADAGADPATPKPSAANEDVIDVVSVARGLEHPWGLAFLPDGRMLVTERPGRLRIVSADGTISAPLAGVPQVAARGQGGLL